MYSTILLALVACSVLLALQNWRIGLVCCLVVGVLQDPVRKVTPDSPIYLTLAFVPIYVAMFVSLWTTQPVLPVFFRYYPHAERITALVLLTLVVSSVQTLSFGLQAWQAIILGLTFYVGWVPALFLGFFYLRRDYRELDWPLTIFGLITATMLVGTLLEYAGVSFSVPVLGMVSYKGQWVRFNPDGQMVAMMSGFYRAPEIMAWHAATLVIVSVYLLVRRPAWAILWIPQAGWGMICVLLGGRRKMFLMVLVFAGCFALLAEGRRRIGILFYLLLAGVLLVFASSYFVNDRYLDSAESGFTSANKRVSGNALLGPIWLFPLVGPFGYGVGTRAQGTQHLQIAFDAPQMEGGFEKVMVELGIVGTIVMIVFVVYLIRVAVLSFRRVWASRMDSTPVAALAGFLIANALTYLVAFQVYGDPFIGFLLGFGGGLLLSASRLVAQQQVWVHQAAVQTPRAAPGASRRLMISAMNTMLSPRLLCVCPGLTAGSGGIQFSCQIAWRGLTEHLQSRGQAADLFVFGELDEADARRGGGTVAVASHKWQAPAAALVRRWRAPLVCFWHVGLLRLLPFLRMPAARVVVVLNGIEVWRPFGFWMRRLLRRVDLFVSISQFTWEQFLRWNPELANRPHEVMALGLDVPWREKTPSPPPPPAALILGRMTRGEDYKGHRELISAWPRVRGHLPDAELWIAGSGDLQPGLEQLAARLGVAAHVRFLGRVSEAAKQDLLQRCRCLAMPSRGEGFGLVYLEAMRLGRPCLVSDCDAGAEVVQPPAAGLAVAPADNGAMVDALVRLLGDGEEWRRWSEVGRRRYEAHFTARHYQESLVRTLLGD